MDPDFKDKSALITGAASGLGLSIAKKLSDQGARLALADADGKKLRAAASEMRPETLIFPVNIGDEEAVKGMVEEITRAYHRIDILINCAGITGRTAIKSHEVSSVDLGQVWLVNFMGSFYTSKYVLPLMIENKYGRILHVASIAGKEGNAGMLAYSVSKAAVIAMAKVQGKEYAEHNITVNAISPAVIQTPLVDAMPVEQVKYMTDKIPMKRCGTLEEFSEMASFIVSGKNSFCTAFSFDLSGGRATY